MIERHLFLPQRHRNIKILHSSNTGFTFHQQWVFICCTVSTVHLILYESHSVKEIILLLQKQFEIIRTSTYQCKRKAD